MCFVVRSCPALCDPVECSPPGTTVHGDSSGKSTGVGCQAVLKVRNRFKGLDLIDRVPDELCNEVRDIVQETGIKTIPMEKKCKKAKWLSGEAL